MKDKGEKGKSNLITVLSIMLIIALLIEILGALCLWSIGRRMKEEEKIAEEQRESMEEESREQEEAYQERDKDIAEDIRKNVEIAATIESVYVALLENDGEVIIVENGRKVTSQVDEMQSELRSIFPDEIEFRSEKYKGRTYQINIKILEDGNLRIEGEWSSRD